MSLDRLTAALSDRYRIERELGAGGMATVYLAHDVKHDRKVALKVLKPELAAVIGADRFVVEIKTTAALQHPHILPLFDSGRAGGHEGTPEFLYYVMPYIEGETLRGKLDRETQFGIDEAVRITVAVADALDYAHRHGVIHRDIKPENILLHDGRPIVADFGIALALSAAAGGRMTETGMSLGTPHYMSPEQATADKEITGRSDIYSLGSVLYEMLAGEPPHIGHSAQQIIMKIIAEEVQPVTKHRKAVPANVAAAVAKSLERLPADRFATAKEFADALGNTAFATVATNARGLAVSPPRRLAASLPWAVALLLAGVAAWGWFRPGPPPPPLTRIVMPLPSAAPAGWSPIISPDGTRLVYVGLDSARTPSLYLRSMNGEVPTRIAGTEGVTNSAYFSPDGLWVLYRQGGKLRKVNVAGGAAVVICDLPGALSGLAWGPRDQILFSTADTLYLVSAAGGAPVALFGPDTATGTRRFSSPYFLPDGRQAVATRITTGTVELVVIDLEAREFRSLGIAGMTPAYVDAGSRLVYADASGTLLSVPFDPRRAVVTGAAEPLAENVSVNQGTFARFSISRTGTAAYYSGLSSEAREIVQLDRSGRGQPLPIVNGPYRYPRYSPDGRQVAVGLEAGGRAVIGDIWIYDFASRRISRMTFDTSSASPEWSPDGRSVIYMRFGGGIAELYRVAVNGSADPVPYFKRSSAGVFESRLTPDGQRLVFREDLGIRNIMVAHPDSPGTARPLAATGFNERGIALSRDGRWLAFTSNLAGRNEVYLRGLEEGSPRTQVSNGGGVEPRWGAGGREILYRFGDSVFVVPVQLGAEARMGTPRALFSGSFNTSGNEALWDVSPDGQRLLMVRPLSGATSASLHMIFNAFGR